MKPFPPMVQSLPRVPDSQQNTPDISGNYGNLETGGQIAFWSCKEPQDSKEHRNSMDEYILCIEGEYRAVIQGKEVVLNKGDELFIPKGVLQSGSCTGGTRTMHLFGGKRITHG